MLIERSWTHREKAFVNAANTLKRLDYRLLTAKEAEKIAGMGPSTSTAIEEYVKSRNKLIRNGKDPKKATSKYYEEQITKYEEKTGKSGGKRRSVVEEFKTIYGIGTVKANKLYDAGIHTLKKLKKKRKEVLNNKQLIGLKHREDFLKRIPREEIDDVKTKIVEVLDKLSLENSIEYEFDIVGSYRRGESTSGDIDL